MLYNSSNFQETYYGEKYRNWYSSIMQLEIDVVRDAVHREYGGTIYEDKILEFTDDRYYDKMIDLTHRNGRYSVLGHGDCWIMNFLLKYVDDKPTQAKMIDYQLVRYGSPALDLSFFFYSCTTQQLREEHYDSLLKVDILFTILIFAIFDCFFVVVVKIYHQSVADLLAALGSDPNEVFPYSCLLQEMRESARFGVGMGMEAIPLSIMDDADLADLDSIENSDGVPMSDIWNIKPIKSKEGRLRLANTVKHAVDQGYFN